VSVTEADTGSRPGGLRRRVVLLAESAGLAAVLGHLLGPGDRLSRLDSLRDLADRRALEGADVVVLDLPDEDQAVAVGHVRRCYHGPLVVLAGQGEDPDASGLDNACTLVARPFSVEALSAALAGRPWLPPPAAGAVPALAAAAAAGAAPGRRDLPDRAQRLLVALVEGWQTHRQVRVAGFAVLALLAFTVAFVLAVQGRCGPGCGQLGTGVSPAPTITSIQPWAAPTTGPRHPTSTTTIRVGSPGTGAFLGTTDRRRATVTTTTASSRRRAATTTSRRAAVTTRPATTRPPTTQSTAPPTTGPTTTAAPPTTVNTTDLGTS
jgi:DNA-binding NarL/FixJ family response regulator